MTTALVLGGATCLWADVEAALELGEYQLVVACNDAGAAWPGQLDAWVSLHPEKFNIWNHQRAKAGHPPAGRILGHANATPGRVPPCVSGLTDHLFPGQVKCGSSGLFAAKVALIDLGADRAVLCGVPLTSAQGHFFDDAAWRDANAYAKGWHEALPIIRDRLRSLSGWTRELLGAPTPEWIRGAA